MPPPPYTIVRDMDPELVYAEYMTDSPDEAIELPRLKEEMGKLKARREALERERRQLERLHQEQVRGEDALVRLEAFCKRVSQGLENLSFEERQKLLRLVVDRIVVDGQHVRIEGVIPQGHTPEIALRPTRPVDG